MPVSSTFSTSAPKSASNSEQKPPGSSRERSSTRTPLSGKLTATPPPDGAPPCADPPPLAATVRPLGRADGAPPCAESPPLAATVRPVGRPSKTSSRAQRPLARCDPQQSAGLSDARRSATHVFGHLPRLRDQLAVRPRHLAIWQIQVVLQPHPDRPAQRQRRRHEHPLLARDP